MPSASRDLMLTLPLRDARVPNSALSGSCQRHPHRRSSGPTCVGRVLFGGPAEGFRVVATTSAKLRNRRAPPVTLRGATYTFRISPDDPVLRRDKWKGRRRHEAGTDIMQCLKGRLKVLGSAKRLVVVSHSRLLVSPNESLRCLFASAGSSWNL